MTFEAFRYQAQAWDDAATELRESAEDVIEPERSVQLAIAWTHEQCARQLRMMLRPVAVPGAENRPSAAQGDGDGT